MFIENILILLNTAYINTNYSGSLLSLITQSTERNMKILLQSYKCHGGDMFEYLTFTEYLLCASGLYVLLVDFSNSFMR